MPPGRTSPPTTLSEGSALGPYRIESFLGAGGMATVFRARDMRNGNEYALKVLASNLGRNEKIVRRFRQEAAIQNHISHPGIVHAFDFIEDGNNIALVMELVRGVTLEEWMSGVGRPASLTECGGVMVPVLDALAVAHAAGVVHRDLKPSNILLASAGDATGFLPKISDFGVAKVLLEAGVKTATGADLGTAWYMAPEQCRGARDVDARADIYSAGIVLFQMAAGSLPFDGESDFAIMEGHIRTAPARPSVLNSQVSSALESVILQAIEKTPSDRFQSALAFRAALDAACSRPDLASLIALRQGRLAPAAEAPGQSLPSGPAQAPAAGRKRRRTVLAAVSMCLGVALALIAFFAPHGPETSGDGDAVGGGAADRDAADDGVAPSDEGSPPDDGATRPVLDEGQPGPAALPQLDLPACPRNGDPDTAQKLFKDAQQLLALGYIRDALNTYADAAAADPRDALVQGKRAYELVRNGRPTEALEPARLAASCRPASVTYMRLADVLVNLGRDAQALAAYEWALSKDPSDTAVLLRKGNLLWLLGRQDEARTSWRLACSAGSAKSCQQVRSGLATLPTDDWRRGWGTGSR